MCSLLLLLTLSAACGGTSDREGTPVVQESPPPSPPEPDPYLNPNLADGFDFPVGNPDGKGAYTCLADGKRYDSWYKAVEFAEIYTPFEWIHPGEDWNGVGGGNTDLGQPVHSIAKGMVDLAEDQGALWGKVIVIRHEYVENGSPETVFSLYVHLGEMLVEEGQAVQRREQIGTVGRDPDGYYYAHLHLEIRKSSMENYPPDYWPSSAGNTVEWVREHYYPPTEFISQHRQIAVPVMEETFIRIAKGEYKLYFYRKGELDRTYEIAHGQDPVGPKRREGDRKVPEGEYRICQKAEGPFGDDYSWGPFFGPRWIKINYPNAFDARSGLTNKRITTKECDAILRAIDRGETPPQKTELGGGIGIHGWIPEGWSNEDSRNMTWGCISMHDPDLVELYDAVDVGTLVIITE